MPIYAYLCTQCGPFERIRPMSDSHSPQQCPECDAVSERMLTAVNLNIMAATPRKVHQLNEKSAHEPRVSGGHAQHGHNHSCQSHGHKHGPGCGHDQVTKTAQPTASRPWQVGH